MAMDYGNMFADVFRIRQSMFGDETAEDGIRDLREDVQSVIEGKREVPKLRFISFKMTNYCNSDCSYCVHARSRHEDHKQEIPTDIVFRAIDDAARLGCAAIAVNGGEPLLMPHVTDIIKRIREDRIVPVLMTNALLLPDKWEELGEAGLRFIIISFDSMDKEVYEKQRGASFEQALAGIDAACRLREKYGDTEIYISATLTQDNFADIRKLLEFTAEKKIKLQFSPFHNYLGDRGKDFRMESDRTRRQIGELIDMKKEGCLVGSSVGYMSHFADYFLEHKAVPDGYRCKMGFCNVCIDAEMNVKSCWSQNLRPLGNLAEASLYDIWNSELAREQRGMMLRGECEGCWYMCTEITMLADDRLFS
ncbi:MAG: radical SAM protein [Lachnospiraceae bacterium]|nr:radical SAM protein [Lachnospiraceae bacterium]